MKNNIDIMLPQYYEKLVEAGSATLSVTQIGKPFARIGGEVFCDRVRVYLDKKYDEPVKFYWQVVAERRNTRFNVEPKKTEVEVKRLGPYTWM